MCQYRRERVIFLLFVLIVILYGCANKEDGKGSISEVPVEESVIRVLVDVDIAGNVINPSAEEALKKFRETGDGGYESFAKAIKSLGGPTRLQLEFPPARGERRDTYLTSLRTEIMAGKGPDVFICAAGPAYVMDYTRTQEGGITGEWEAPLFPFPRQAMKRNIFLCLDEYIEGFQFADWGSFAPAVTDVGKWEGRQYLLPMSYTLPVTVFKKSDFQHTCSQEMTWQDMLDGGPELQAAAVLDSSIYMSNAFMPLVDAAKDELSFSEQELLEFMTKKIHIKQELLAGGNLPDYSLKNLSVGFDERLDEAVFPAEEPLTLIPCYTQEGGYGATVASFAAVNANTEYPKAAAFLVDYVLSEECQKSVLYSYIASGMAVPIMDSLLQEGGGLESIDGSWALTQENYDAFCNLRDGIASADFSTQLNVEFQKLYIDIIDSKDKEAIKKLVHDAYMRMSMELAES